MSPEQRVLFIRFGAIGNAVAASPAVRALRRAWPDSYAAILADPLTSELWQGCPYLDEVIVYDQKEKNRAGPGYLKLIRELRRKRFTHSIHFRRFIRSELIGYLAGIPERIGFETEARIQLLTAKVPYTEGVSVIELNLGLLNELGIESEDTGLEDWPRAGSARVRELFSALSGDGPVVVIHPGGGTQRDRLWPYYGELGAAMQERHGARIILIGDSSETGIISMTEKKMQTPAAKALGFSLVEVMEIMRAAKAFAGTDSGPCHLAAMTGTPGAIIYAPHPNISAQIRKWKPAGENYLAFGPERDCEGCPDYPCPLEKQKECAASIRLEEVIKGLEKLLSR